MAFKNEDTEIDAVFKSLLTNSNNVLKKQVPRFDLFLHHLT
jgi:hypothetical protein